MSEERRIAPGSSSLDTAAAAPARAGSSSPPPSPSSPPPDGGHRARTRDSSPAVRKRNRLSLRIPDDEIARPQALTPSDEIRVELPPPSPVPPADTDVENAGVLRPTRIISIGPSTPMPEVDVSARETPVEPEGVDVHFDDEPVTPLVTPVASAHAIPPRALLALEPLPAVRAALASVPAPPPPAAVSPPVAAPTMRSVEPVAAAAPPGSVAPPPPPVAVSVRLPSESEIAAADVVAVDATPAPPKVAVVAPPSMRPRLPSQPAAVTIPHRAPPPVAPAIRAKRPPLVIVPPHMGSVGPQVREGSGVRRKGRFWWEELFNDDYLRTIERLTEAQLTSEVDFIEESLGIERGGALLDLACGTGRHAIELARRGYEIVGFDLSLPMLARASEEAQEKSAKLNFVQGDMREMSFAEQFDGVYCWNTSFGYFEEEKNALVIDRIHSALKAGGLLLLDVANRDFVVQQSPSLAWFEGDGCVCMDEMVVDFITSRVRIKRTMMLDDGRSREIEYSMRAYSLHELGRMLHEHGFKVCEVSGRISTPGVFLGHDSPRTIVLAEKR